MAAMGSPLTSSGGGDRARIVVVGDSGVGKSSLVHLICHRKPLSNPSWTVGCSVDILLHESGVSRQHGKVVCLEFWDVGGAKSYRKARHMFYKEVNGIILVHDLTNKKSHTNLHRWINEILTCLDGNQHGFGVREGIAGKESGGGFDSSFDPEKFAGDTRTMIPVIIVGTKLDQVKSIRELPSVVRRSSIAEDLGCDSIVLSTQSTSHLDPSSNSGKHLALFLQKVADCRRSTGGGGGGGGGVGGSVGGHGSSIGGATSGLSGNLNGEWGSNDSILLQSGNTLGNSSNVNVGGAGSGGKRRPLSGIGSGTNGSPLGSPLLWQTKKR
eukprot:Nk52_evm9s2630 gene=Nk52_evmTU9s2630